MRAILWDSSAILALLDADDADHESAVAVAAALARERLPGFITNYIEVEAHALLLRKLGRGAALQWLLQGGLPILRAHPGEEEAARALLGHRADKEWSLCDAISFSLIESRAVAEAFSFDHHFVQWGKVRVRS